MGRKVGGSINVPTLSCRTGECECVGCINHPSSAAPVCPPSSTTYTINSTSSSDTLLSQLRSQILPNPTSTSTSTSATGTGNVLPPRFGTPIPQPVDVLPPLPPFLTPEAISRIAPYAPVSTSIRARLEDLDAQIAATHSMRRTTNTLQGTRDALSQARDAIRNALVHSERLERIASTIRRQVELSSGSTPDNNTRSPPTLPAPSIATQPSSRDTGSNAVSLDDNDRVEWSLDRSLADLRAASRELDRVIAFSREGGLLPALRDDAGARLTASLPESRDTQSRPAPSSTGTAQASTRVGQAQRVMVDRLNQEFLDARLTNREARPWTLAYHDPAQAPPQLRGDIEYSPGIQMLTGIRGPHELESTTRAMRSLPSRAALSTFAAQGSTTSTPSTSSSSSSLTLSATSPPASSPSTSTARSAGELRAPAPEWPSTTYSSLFNGFGNSPTSSLARRILENAAAGRRRSSQGSPAQQPASSSHSSAVSPLLTAAAAAGETSTGSPPRRLATLGGWRRLDANGDMIEDTLSTDVSSDFANEPSGQGGLGWAWRPARPVNLDGESGDGIDDEDDKDLPPWTEPRNDAPSNNDSATAAAMSIQHSSAAGGGIGELIGR